MSPDIVIVGAGPAGLCLARALSGHGLSIVVLERQAEQALAEPAFDGREIALTHGSQALLERLGLWARLPTDDIAVLRDAQVFNGPSLFALKIRAEQAGAERLGHLVANQAIRRAAYQAVRECADVQLLCETGVRAIHPQANALQLVLQDGQVLQPRLLVAADSRFSETRRQLGIGAQLKDFGKSMLVCRMQHEQDHQQVAWEWFGYGQTLALLPLNGRQSSVVLTLPPREIERLQQLDDARFAREMEQRFERRLGAMQLVSSRHAYPLVGAYARRMVGTRCALIGDAAVGMHPVTAHGFNFGLGSVQRLSEQLLTAWREGQDIGAAEPLARYERQQRLATWPLYQATNLLVELYTNDRLPMRLLRGAGLRVAQGLLPLKRGIAQHLTARG
ncbi:5-demethoxyubiquinol-8 5-hydroxylase UbiM [Ectopseudomonas hydrolytica]|uniref:5-demethoxyubiquinol-8 5-hydroxylase UbiM n=1 Tax=Ectopseudomonas hydrolytica TaxID=2493633 RepID=A0ABY5AC11_9GAMM|nr:5-demethoxyubiquinol-8 5-hydroxylase UbiM [Pseudomonas hydrolytica]USR41193.1 5-demethoxyubiquinol-8 5-hydroxylase UbiM [Pseudomonas hydrolytica]